MIIVIVMQIMLIRIDDHYIDEDEPDLDVLIKLLNGVSLLSKLLFFHNGCRLHDYDEIDNF